MRIWQRATSREARSVIKLAAAADGAGRSSAALGVRRAARAYPVVRQVMTQRNTSCGTTGTGGEQGPSEEELLQQLLGGASNSLGRRPAKKRGRSSPQQKRGNPPPEEPTEGGAGLGSAPAGRSVLLWLRQDLRLHDNPALLAAAGAAAQRGGKLVPVFVHSPEEDGDHPQTGNSWRPGAASLVWLHGALACLDVELRQRYGAGAGIVYCRGPYLEALLRVAGAAGAGAVHYSRRYEPAMQATDKGVAAGLQASGLQVRAHATFLLRAPTEVAVDMRKWTGHFGTLMPFFRACQRLAPVPSPQPSPAQLPVERQDQTQRLGGLLLEDLELARMPRRPDGTAIDWAAPIRGAWDFSEAAALRLLDDFLEAGLKRYEGERQYADGRAVSRLSPYLHWGQLSARHMLRELEARQADKVSKTFWRRLVWRDLAYWQLHHWPAMPSAPVRMHYAGMEWTNDPAALRAWQRGQTGFPLVDAGMRELWATGWMQQSVRMACACFLTEYLGVSWVAGAAWFHDCLVDADLAINSMMWQSAGRTGLDPWSFTVLPTSKAQDPTGAYIARWVPELAQLPAKHRHEPWAAPPEGLAAAGVELGVTYPLRLTGAADLRALRERTLERIRSVRQAAGPEWQDADGYDLVDVPQGSVVGWKAGQKLRVFTLPACRSGAGDVERGGGNVRKAPVGAGGQRRRQAPRSNG